MLMTKKNLFAVATLIGVSACGLPIPFEWESEPQSVDVDALLGDKAFTVPEGEDVEAARALIEEYFGEHAADAHWPDGMDEVVIDIPLMQTFPVDLSDNESLAQATDSVSAVAVDVLEVNFLQNTLNYDVPSFHLFTVADGVTPPNAQTFNTDALPDGIAKIGTLTGVDAGSVGNFALSYADNGKQLLSDALLSRKFNVMVFTTLQFNSQILEGLVPSGAVEVRAHISGRFLTER